MREYPILLEWDKVKVWDTMTWEYRDSGHTEKMASLEELACNYSIPFTKSLDLGALLDQGIKMEDIPKVDLKKYLLEDVAVLTRIFDEQQASGNEYDMDYILPLAEMELNGLTVDRLEAQKMMQQLVVDTGSIEDAFIAHLKHVAEWQDGTPLLDEDFTDLEGTKSKYIKPMSARTLSFILTGEPKELKVTQKWRVRYRKGHIPMYPAPPLAMANLTANHLGYPMGEEVLSKLTDWFSVETLRYRGMDKLLGTYISPFMYTSAVQGTIHPKLNTAVTGTGRLSSSAPNGQNIPVPARELMVPKDVKDSMVEVDFKQLEIVAVACVSGCTSLQRDLAAGVDVHYVTGKSVFGWKTPADMNEKDRKTVKGVNFGLLYGGKAAGLAKQTGVDKKIVQELIDSFYINYPAVGKWQEKVFEEICDTMYCKDIKEGEQVYASLYTDPFSGRKWEFIEQRSPKWLQAKTHRKFSFSPQQTSNYPVQGFAGGDIVMTALTELWKELRGRVRFVMTVHDSIIMEADDIPGIERAMDVACFRTEQKFNLPVALGYDLETGKHWS
jgi:DNA polymerase I-like protein with 3'-5' exonuclease and polymerase domains